MVRFDEWGVWTPAMLSQANQTPPFPIENTSLGSNRAPLLMSVPVSYYTILFRPQLWGFFVFDFERGFAFYWGCKVFGLLLALGWMLRQIGLRSRSLVIFGATWVFFSSYTQWWFSSPAMLPEMITSWAMCIGCTALFLKNRSRRVVTIAFAAFIFFGINFILCLYPPYQIPLLILGIAMALGIWLESRHDGELKLGKRATLLLAAAVAAILLILLPFWIDVRSTLEIVAQTAYPGGRRSTGGDLSLFKLFSGLIGFFEAEQVGPDVYPNIAEASNFYPLWPAAVLTMFVARFRRKTDTSPLLVSLAILLIGLSLYCVLPMPAWLLKGTLLSFTTERRTLLAIGLANIFLCCLVLDRYRTRVFTNRGGVLAGVGLWLAIVSVLWLARGSNAAFFSDPWHFVQPIIISAVILSLFFWEPMRHRWLPPVFGLLLVFSNAGINPVMRGLSPLMDSVAFKTIARIRASDPGGKWIAYDTRHFAQLIKATGATVFNGTKILPDLELMRKLDPQGKNNVVYNRYANIGCDLSERKYDVGFAGTIYPDFYVVALSPENPILRERDYRYLLFPHSWPGAASCGFALVEEIQPSRLWIYRRNEIQAPN
jgi:hypothetical protein